MTNIADKEELLKVYDEYHNFTGKYEKRSIVHSSELFHNEVALWIINKDKKQVLLQKRSPFKKINPNKFGLCAGHVVEDETIDEALKKEAFEEIGLDISKFDVKELAVIKRIKPNNHHFSHHYYILADIPLSNLTIQQEELSELKYLDYEELKSLVKQNSDKVVFKWNEVYKLIFNKLDEIIYN